MICHLLMHGNINIKVLERDLNLIFQSLLLARFFCTQEVMFLFCLFVCKQDYETILAQSYIKFERIGGSWSYINDLI